MNSVFSKKIGLQSALQHSEIQNYENPTYYEKKEYILILIYVPSIERVIRID